MLCSQSRLAPYVVVRSELITVRAGDNLCYNNRCGAARVHRSAALPPLFSQNDKAMFFFYQFFVFHIKDHIRPMQKSCMQEKSVSSRLG